MPADPKGLKLQLQISMQVLQIDAHSPKTIIHIWVVFWFRDHYVVLY